MSACRASSRAAPLIRGAPARSRPRRRVARAAQGPLPEALAAAPQLHQQPAVGEIASIGADIAPAAEAVLGPFFAIMSVAFITRIVMSWDPNIKDETMPWLFGAWLASALAHAHVQSAARKAGRMPQHIARMRSRSSLCGVGGRMQRSCACGVPHAGHVCV